MLRPLFRQAIGSGAGLMAVSTALCLVSQGPAHALLTLDLFATPATGGAEAGSGRMPGGSTAAAPACGPEAPGCSREWSFDDYFCTGSAWPEGDVYGLSVAAPAAANQEIDSVIRAISPQQEALTRQRLKAGDTPLLLAGGCLARAPEANRFNSAPPPSPKDPISPVSVLLPGLAGGWVLSLD